jgi:hypothetical protein
MYGNLSPYQIGQVIINNGQVYVHNSQVFFYFKNKKINNGQVFIT